MSSLRLALKLSIIENPNVPVSKQKNDAEDAKKRKRDSSKGKKGDDGDQIFKFECIFLNIVF